MAKRSLTLSALSALLVAAFLTGCGSADPVGTDQPVPVSSLAFQTISLTTTGGVAGVNQTVTVDATGAITVRGRGGPSTSPSGPAGKLGNAELARLQALIGSAAFRSVQPVYGPADPKVSDQFTHEVTVGFADRKVTTKVENPALAPREVVQLIELLTGAGHGSRTGP